VGAVAGDVCSQLSTDGRPRPLHLAGEVGAAGEIGARGLRSGWIGGKEGRCAAAPEHDRAGFAKLSEGGRSGWQSRLEKPFAVMLAVALVLVVKGLRIASRREGGRQPPGLLRVRRRGRGVPHLRIGGEEGVVGVVLPADAGEAIDRLGIAPGDVTGPPRRQNMTERVSKALRRRPLRVAILPREALCGDARGRSRACSEGSADSFPPRRRAPASRPPSRAPSRR
jgi:hypothetical protein